MESKHIKSLIFLGGLFAFHLCFWQENLGVNTIFFSLLSVAMLYVNFPSSRRETPFWISSAGTMILALMVAFHHSDFSIFAWCVSWTILVGIGTFSGVHEVFVAFFQGLSNLFSVPTAWSSKFDLALPRRTATDEDFVPENKSGLRASLFVLPTAIVIGFICLYSMANEHFAAAIGQLLKRFFLSFDWIWDLFSFRWLVFLLFGIFFIGALVWRNSDAIFSNWQTKSNYFIPTPEKMPNFNQLNDQYWTAFLTLAMLNALILVFNVQEFFNITQQSDAASASAFRHSVHFGTYILIFSIIVAMGLLFHFFKNELNFTEKSPTLRLLAYAWIAQNGVMVLTVAMRNYQYINNYGLAYKRVGVIFFLLLTLFGLVTMVLKIKDFRTFRNIFMLNGWSFYFTLVLIACVNWDVFITRFNLSHMAAERLDLRFLLEEVSDKNLHVLLEYRNQLPNKTYHESSWFGLVNEDINVNQMLENKITRFQKRMNENQETSFMSWNWIDDINKKAVLSK
jgi:hypothetical protein